MISNLTECDNVQILLNVVRKGVNNMSCSFLMLTVLTVLELSPLLWQCRVAVNFYGTSGQFQNILKVENKKSDSAKNRVQQQ